METPEQYTRKVLRNLNYARSAFAALSAGLGLITLILFGANMDTAHFPGANIVLDSYQSEIANKTNYNVDLAGDLMQVFGGFQIKVPEQCTNFVGTSYDENNNRLQLRPKQLDATGDAEYPCDYYDTKENKYVPLTKHKDSTVEDARWRGWVVAQSCTKTADTEDCAPFSAVGPLAGFGAATFGVLAIRSVLFGAHTCVMLLADSVSFKNAVTSTGKQRAFLGLNIIWVIVSFSLFVWAAVAWQGMCDKIDTGLGRIVQVGNDYVQACATSYCNISFGGFFASYAAAMFVFRFPNILIWAGIVDGPTNGYQKLPL